MPSLYILATVEVGDGTSHLQDAVVCASGESQAIHRLLQDCLSILIDKAVLAHHPAGHLRVAEHAEMVRKARFLNLSCRHHPFADFETFLRRFVAGKLLMRYGHHLYMKVGTSWDYRGRFI